MCMYICRNIYGFVAAIFAEYVKWCFIETRTVVLPRLPLYIGYAAALFANSAKLFTD